MSDTAEIQTKIEKLPEHAKRELMEFIEILVKTYSISDEKQSDRVKNPLSEIAGFAEIGKMDSKDIDKEIYNL
jgi:hypothetical protein